ncbi:FG-GAP repeat domain-containing protein [Luteolibacter luteus]|uniref:VCBS repeat-containing protein n=1 Tax=Luteolibacter luteus TaxID=2728835 RepID=A0A858RJM7_9BACT|nr:VCBS repeat-containing protein [Luteolibacter luteus]QJE96781.1 VCBS repeat-containing protein [Luteolibacter luteus]
MRHSFSLRLLPLSLLLAASASARTPDQPVDAAGRPVLDSNSQPLFYDTPGIPAPVEASSPLARSLAAPPFSGREGEPWNLPPSPGGTPFWSYAMFGTQIGLGGLVTADGEDGKHLFVSATGSASFGANNFWYVLRHNPATGSYDQIHVQVPYQDLHGDYWGPRLVSLKSGNVLGGSGDELVVALEDGRIFFYSLSTFQELAAIQPVQNLTQVALADLTRDGTAELLVLTYSGLKVFSSTGTLLWSVSGVSGSDLVVAQMDGDPGLEIATTSGHVIDADNHSIQWTRSGGFGAHLRTADIDGDSRHELIAAEGWYNIYAFDVDQQVAKWSYRTGLDISSIEIGNVDADPAPELLYGDNQHGGVHVLSLGAVTPVEKWSVPGYDSGIPRIAVVDADQDGAVELIWSGGSNTTGQDRLNVLDPIKRALEWQSIHLDGPFVRPAIGDVTGDGKPELVTASWESESGYGSGRILVFDPETLALLGTSQPIASDRSWTGLRDLKLRDIDGDGRREIVVAADWLYDGIVEIYAFTDASTFELKWETAQRPSGSPITDVEVIDVDGDGNLEVVMINDQAHSGSEGSYLRVVDLATRAEEWRSANLSSSWSGATSLAVGDADGDGNVEALVAVSGTGVLIFDLKSRVQEATVGGSYTVVTVRPGETGFIGGREDGTITRHLADAPGHYFFAGSWKASADSITGLTPGAGQSLWVSAGKRIQLWPDQATPVWSSAVLGNVNGGVALYEGEDGTEVYAGLTHGVGGFKIGSATDFATVNLDASGQLAEGSTDSVTLTFTRSAISETPTEVVFSLYGQATAEEDYSVEGATSRSDGNWTVTIPANQTTAVVTLGILQDFLSEGPEVISAGLESASGYFLGSPSVALIPIEDDEPVVSVVASDPYASELRAGSASDNGFFRLSRTGNLSRSLKVRVGLSGSAIAGIDYRKINPVVVFPKGKDTVELRIVPTHDRRAEEMEEVQLQVLPTGLYRISESEQEASLSIADAEPGVALDGVTQLRGAMLVNLRRSGGHTLPMTVTVFVTRREANGAMRASQEKAVFKAGSATAGYLVRPASRAKGPAEITVQLIETGEFHLLDSAPVSFTLEP